MLAMWSHFFGFVFIWGCATGPADVPTESTPVVVGSEVMTLWGKVKLAVTEQAAVTRGFSF